MKNTLQGIAFAAALVLATGAAAEDRKVEGGIGLDLPLFERLSNGGSDTGIILADFFHVGIPLQGSMRLADQIRSFLEFTPVFRLKDTDLGFFEGYRLVPGITYDLDEHLYVKGGFLIRNDRIEVGSFSVDDTSIGLDPRIGYRNPIDEGMDMILEAGLPFTLTGDVKELPTLVVRAGVQKKF